MPLSELAAVHAHSGNDQVRKWIVVSRRTAFVHQDSITRSGPIQQLGTMLHRHCLRSRVSSRAHDDEISVQISGFEHLRVKGLVVDVNRMPVIP